MKNADTPAAPVKPEVIQGNQQVHLGLTKREAAAIRVMASCISLNEELWTLKDMAIHATEAADELFKELSK